MLIVVTSSRSPRPVPAGSGRRGPAARVLAVGAVLLAAVLLPTTVAAADPTLPTDASQAQQQLADLSRQASEVNEQVLRATDTLAAAQQAERTARTAETDATAALDTARTQQEDLQGTVDQLTAATYQGARVDGLAALVLSSSPQQLLDQMTALDALAEDTTTRVQAYGRATADAAGARDAAATAAQQAAGATADAARTAAELTGAQQDLGSRTAQVRASFEALTPTERAGYAGETTPAGYTAPTGTGVGGAALAAALTRTGSPYEWGATGPGSFDCSGLVQWAYAQAGVPVPRTSQAQGQVGTHVDVADLQPGDIVTFYAGATHVGIYAGDGMIVHASDYGIPVKVATLAHAPVNDARRL